MAIKTKEILVSDISGEEIPYTTDGGKITGYMVHGNVYVAKPDVPDNSGLIGDNFPKKKNNAKPKRGSRNGMLTIDNVRVTVMTPHEIMDRLDLDEDQVISWLANKGYDLSYVKKEVIEEEPDDWVVG